MLILQSQGEGGGEKAEITGGDALIAENSNDDGEKMKSGQGGGEARPEIDDEKKADNQIKDSGGKHNGGERKRKNIYNPGSNECSPADRTLEDEVADPDKGRA